MKAVKFNFGKSFDAPAQKLAAPPVIYGEDDIKAARAASFSEGDRAGYERAMAEIARQAADAATNIAASMSSLFDHEGERREKARADATAIGSAIAMKFAPGLVGACPLSEVRAMILECLDTAITESRLLVRVAEPLVDEVKKVTDEMAASRGFSGKFVILGDPQLQSSDCRVEWADGGAERSEVQIEADIDRIVSNYINARRVASNQPMNS